jgi:hypothetical protein
VTVDPRDRKSWQGFLDLLRPPPGYRVVAALGTTFGLSFDALTAALLAMLGTDGEELARDPVAGVIAITRLRASVRVLVHPGTSRTQFKRQSVSFENTGSLHRRGKTQIRSIPSEGLGASL